MYWFVFNWLFVDILVGCQFVVWQGLFEKYSFEDFQVLYSDNNWLFDFDGIQQV